MDALPWEGRLAVDTGALKPWKEGGERLHFFVGAIKARDPATAEEVLLVDFMVRQPPSASL